MLLAREKDFYVIFYDFPNQSPSNTLPHIGHNSTKQLMYTSSMLYDRRRIHQDLIALLTMDLKVGPIGFYPPSF